jgi:hypothetical protein
MSDENPYNSDKKEITKEGIQKAIATFKKIFNGKNIEDIEQAKTFCSGVGSKVLRNISMLPIGLDKDPFLLFFGSIRDQQFNS